MKKLLLILGLLPISFFISSQTADNPFEKLGYKPLVATLTRGEFEEFHDQKDIVEIGSVLYNTRTKEIVGFLEEGQTTLDVSSAAIATSIDPLCEKYYWISPYAYVANNPLKFIDPDGRKIVIVVGNKEYTYNGKNVTSSTGKTMDVPKNTHLGKAVQAYNTIRNSGDPVLASKVQHLMNSENTHYIVDKNPEQSPNSVRAGSRKTAVSQDKANVESGKGISTTTLFDFSAKQKAETKASMGIGSADSETVAHEMQHQFDYDTGNMADSYGKTSSATNPAEIRAVNNENRMRVTNGSEKRTTYGGVPIDPKKLK